MKRVWLLRIAAAITLLFALGHSLGGLKQWSPMGPNPVLRAMTENHFSVMGASRSYLDFYMGFGWWISMAALLQAFLLWQMARIVRAGGAVEIRPMIGAFAVAGLTGAVISWLYIFMLPAIFSTTLFVVLVGAYLVAD
jgi:hypothetical protein